MDTGYGTGRTIGMSEPLGVQPLAASVNVYVHSRGTGYYKGWTYTQGVIGVQKGWTYYRVVISDRSTATSTVHTVESLQQSTVRSCWQILGLLTCLLLLISFASCSQFLSILNYSIAFQQLVHVILYRESSTSYFPRLQCDQYFIQRELPSSVSIQVRIMVTDQ